MLSGYSTKCVLVYNIFSYQYPLVSPCIPWNSSNKFLLKHNYLGLPPGFKERTLSPQSLPDLPVFIVSHFAAHDVSRSNDHNQTQKIMIPTLLAAVSLLVFGMLVFGVFIRKRKIQHKGVQTKPETVWWSRSETRKPFYCNIRYYIN